MANWYVRMTNGSALNTGTSRAEAMLSIAAAVTASSDGDTIFVSEANATRSHTTHAAINASKNNLTIMQDPDGEQAIWYGGTTVAAAGWAETSGGSNVWDLNIGAGLTPDGCCFDYANLTNARGSHTGSLKLLASRAAVIAAGSGTAGSWFYVGGTGVLTCYFNANPNTAGKTIEIVNRRDVSAIKLVGNGNRVEGIHFKQWHNSVQGACVWLEDGTSSSVITACKSWDCGPHAFVCYGALASVSGANVNGCYSYGAKHDAAHFTFFQTEASGTMSACTWSNCHIERHNWLNLDGTDAGTTAGCTQNGFYCHANSGTPITDVLCSGCTSYDQAVANNPIVDAGGNTAAGTETIWSTYSVRVEGCNFQNMARWVTTSHIAVRRCIFGLQRMGTSTLCRYGGTGCVSVTTAAAKVLCEASLFVMDSTGDGSNSLIGINAAGVANAHIRFLNCTIVDLKSTATGGQSNFITLSATATSALTFTGCILSFVNNTADQQTGPYSDGSTLLRLADNTYGLFPDGFSVAVGSITGTGNPTGLTPSDCDDANPNDLDAYPLVSSTDYRVSQSSALWGDNRATSTLVPNALLNGPYDGSHGAYAQTDPGDTASRGRGTSDSGRSFWRNR